MEVTLAKALKHKNRVTQKMTLFSTDIQANNSILAVNDEPEVDVLALNKSREELMYHLVDLKTAIHRASDPIREKIFLQSELRAAITFYRQINTQHGKREAHRFGVGEEFVENKAIMRKDLIDRTIVELESKIDDIQDALDEFNVTTKISVEIPNAMKRPGLPN